MNEKSELNHKNSGTWFLIQSVGVIFVLFFIWTAFNPFAEHLVMGLFTMTCWSLGFLLYDYRGIKREIAFFKVAWYDWILVLASISTCSYFMLNYEDLIVNLGNLSTIDL